MDTRYPRPPKWRGRPMKRRPKIKPEADHLTAGLASFTVLPQSRCNVPHAIAIALYIVEVTGKSSAANPR
jgi:hypothetical protein